MRGEVLGIFIRNPDRPRWTATPRCVERFCGGEMYFVEEIGSYHRYSCKECGRSQFEDGP